MTKKILFIDLIAKCDSLGVSSIYLPDYISSSDFAETKYSTDIVDVSIIFLLNKNLYNF